MISFFRNFKIIELIFKIVYPSTLVALDKPHEFLCVKTLSFEAKHFFPHPSD